MKKILILFVFVILFCFACSNISKIKIKDGSLIYNDSIYYKIDSNDIFSLCGSRIEVGIYYNNIYFRHDKVYKSEFDFENVVLSVHAIGDNYVFYIKEGFDKPDRDNFTVCKIINENNLENKVDNIIFSQLYEIKNPILKKSINIKNKYSVNIFSSNYSYLFITANIIVDVEENVYIEKSNLSNEYYKIIDKYKALFV